MPEPDLEAMVDELSVWIRTESPTHAPEAVNRMMDLVAAEAEDAPASPVERLAGKHGLGDILILRAGPRSDEPGLLVLVPSRHGASPRARSSTTCRCGARATVSTARASTT